MRDFGPPENPMSNHVSEAGRSFIDNELSIVKMRRRLHETNLIHRAAAKNMTYETQREMMDIIKKRLAEAATMEERLDVFFEDDIKDFIYTADISSVEFDAPISEYDSQRDAFRKLSTAFGIIPYGRQTPEGKPKWAQQDVDRSNSNSMAILTRSKKIGRIELPNRRIVISKRSDIYTPDLSHFSEVSTVRPPKRVMHIPAAFIHEPKHVFTLDEPALERTIDAGYSHELLPVQVSLFAHVKFLENGD